MRPAIFAIVTASLAIVDEMEIAALPSKFAVPVTSPDTAIALAVARVAADPLALPVTLPVRSPVKPSAEVIAPALMSAKS